MVINSMLWVMLWVKTRSLSGLRFVCLLKFHRGFKVLNFLAISRFEFVNKLEAAIKDNIEFEKKNMVIFF